MTTRHSGYVPFDPANDLSDMLFDASILLRGLILPALKTVRSVVDCHEDPDVVQDAVIIQIAMLNQALEAVLAISAATTI